MWSLFFTWQHVLSSFSYENTKPLRHSHLTANHSNNKSPFSFAVLILKGCQLWRIGFFRLSKAKKVFLLCCLHASLTRAEDWLRVGSLRRTISPTTLMLNSTLAWIIVIYFVFFYLNAICPFLSPLSDFWNIDLGQVLFWSRYCESIFRYSRRKNRNYEVNHITLAVSCIIQKKSISLCKTIT